MPESLVVILLTLGAGSTMALGGLVARADRLGWIGWGEPGRHAVAAFGGGALISAVALVLVPEGSERLSIPMVALAFGSGGVAFMLLDVWLARHNTPAGQLAAMLADFVPEALALGAAFAAGSSAGPLLALLIALQNTPEGYNAYNELTRQGGLSGTRVLSVLALLALLGPAAGLTGLWLLAGWPEAVALLMLFAAGGILYLVFEDIAPAATQAGRWAPPLGAVAGFLLGLVGEMLVR